MEIEIIEDQDTKFVFKLHGAGHTFCNALKDQLVQNDDVDIATYTIKHPLVAEPKFYLETHGEDPRELLDAAAESLKEKNEAVNEAYQDLTVES